jgi:pentatricopeptide repeat protein
MKVCGQTVTIVGVLNACASILELEEGRYIHEQIIQSSCKSISFVGNSLVGMYTKYGSMDDAGRVFNKMPLNNVVTWTTMVLGHVKCGQGKKAQELFSTKATGRCAARLCHCCGGAECMCLCPCT